MVATATAADPAPGAAPPNRRAAFQERKRQNTRAAILAAAGRIFACTPYVHATIDEIIAAAGISRATFYTHFESKLGLALAIYEELVPEVHALFDQIPRLDTRTPAAAKAWLRTFADLYVRHGYLRWLFAQLEIFERSFRIRLRTDRDGYMQRLADAGIKRFARAAGKGEQAALQRARARLLLDRLVAVCAEISQPDLVSAADGEAYLEVVAEELRAFLADA